MCMKMKVASISPKISVGNPTKNTDEIIKNIFVLNLR